MGKECYWSVRRWKTEISVLNKGNERVCYDLIFNSKEENKSFEDCIEKGELKYYKDILGEIFGEEFAEGNIRIESELPLLAGSRILWEKELGEAGDFLLGEDKGKGFYDGETGYLIGLSENEEFKTDLVFTEIRGMNSKVKVDFFHPMGKS